MQTIERHGGASHHVRPDGVYRTSVLQPTTNFSPGQDIQAIASSFTERSMNLSGLGAASYPGASRASQRNAFRVSTECSPNSACAVDPCCESATGVRRSSPIARSLFGALGATTNVGIFQKLKNWAAGFKKSDAQHGQAHAPQGHAYAYGQQRLPSVPYAQIGMQVAPSMMGQVLMLAHLTSGTLPRHYAQAQIDTSMQRWNNMRWNG